MSKKSKNRWMSRIWTPGTDIAAYVPRPDVVSYGTADLGRVVLMGDSIFDNEHYTFGEPDVAQRLHGVLGDDWGVSLVARDGATTKSLGWQYRHVPEDTTHLIVSIGGNDANGNHKILLDATPRTMIHSLEELWLMSETFAADYSDAVLPLIGTVPEIILCTIYDCDFSERERYAVKPALDLFNSEILRFAFTHGLPVIDLRTVCTEPEDYEMTIEPSGIGGAKIGRAIANHVTWDRQLAA